MINYKKIFAIALILLFVSNTTVQALTATDLVGGSSITATTGIDKITDNAASTIIKTNDIQGATSTIDWGSLNVGANETLTFNFNGLNQTALNRVTTGLTTIAGKINDSGIGASTSRIIISNPNGMLFESGSYVNANALLLNSLQEFHPYENSGTFVYGMWWKDGQINTAPRTGILLKGEIITQNDTVVVSRGIRVEGAEITTGGDLNLVSGDHVSFAFQGPDIVYADGRTKPSNAGSLRLYGWGGNSSSADAKNPLNISYADGIRSPENILINANSLLKSTKEQIRLMDIRSNNAGINIDSSRLTAPKGLNIEYPKNVTIRNMLSDQNTDVKIRISSYSSAYLGDYSNDGEIYIDGIDKAKSLAMNLDSNLTWMNPTAFIRKITINNAHALNNIYSKTTLGSIIPINSTISPDITITNSSINNKFGVLDSNAKNISIEKDIAITEYNQAFSSNTDSLTALNNAIIAKNAKNLQAVKDAAQIAQDAADQATRNALTAKTAADKTRAQENKTVSNDAVTGAILKVSDRNSQAKTNAQIARDKAADAKTEADQAAANASAAYLLIAETQAKIDADTAAAERQAKIEASERQARIDNSPKNDVNKITGRSKSIDKGTSTPNQNLLAQNIKSFAADETDTITEGHLYKKTANGFSITKKIVR